MGRRVRFFIYIDVMCDLSIFCNFVHIYNLVERKEATSLCCWSFLYCTKNIPFIYISVGGEPGQFDGVPYCTTELAACYDSRQEWFILCDSLVCCTLRASRCWGVESMGVCRD